MSRRGLMLALLLAGFASLAILFSVTTPIFEAPDEPWHFAYVLHLHEGNGLPVQPRPGEQATHLARQEGSQPPLYYLLAAGLTFWIDTGPTSQFIWLNPYYVPARPDAERDRNVAFHKLAEEWPYRGVAQAVHLIRLLSVALGTLTVWATFKLAQEVTRSETTALLAAGLVAFIPQFVFMSGVVNNDSLVTALSTMALWLLARAAGRGWTLRLALAIGLTVGLASLAKYNAVGLWLVVVAALTPELRRGRFIRSVLLGGAAVLAALVAMGWWYVRNAVLYGEPLGVTSHLATIGPRENALGIGGVLGQAPLIWTTFWSMYGWANVPGLPWQYPVYGAVALGAAVGLLLGRRSLPAHPGFWIAGGWFLLQLAGLTAWTLTTSASQGRLLFAALGAVGLWLAVGLARLLPFAGAQAMLLATLAAICAIQPFAVIEPAYVDARLPVLGVSPESVPNRLDIRYGDAFRLVGYDISPGDLSPGDQVTVALYWQALRPLSEAYTTFVHIVGRDSVIAQYDSQPADGRLPTFFWSPGETLRIEYRLTIPQTVAVPTMVRFEIGWYAYPELRHLRAFDRMGQDLGESPGLFDARLASFQQDWTGQPLATFGDAIELLDGSVVPDHSAAGSTLVLTTRWRALRSTATDQSLFVHLLGEDGKLAAQHDGQPAGGFYPTSSWQRGEVITERSVVRLPPDLRPGSYVVVLGWYDLKTMVRLRTGNDDRFRLGEARIDYQSR